MQDTGYTQLSLDVQMTQARGSVPIVLCALAWAKWVSDAAYAQLGLDVQIT